MRDALDMRGDNVNFGKMPHKGTHVVLIHDQQMSKWKLGARGINRDDSGRVFFYCVDNVLAIDGVSGEIKTRFFKVAFKNDAGSFLAKTAVPVAVHSYKIA